MAVRFADNGSGYRLCGKRELASWLQAVAREEGFTKVDLTYIFCTSQAHREINRCYLNHDYFTDVITFDYREDPEQRIIYGEVYVDPQTVADNAGLYGAPPAEEMHRVLVHGLLHLCGYGDATDHEKTEMRSREDRWLAELVQRYSLG